MFTIDIRINGSMIVHIYGVNEGLLYKGKEKNKTQYRYELYQTDLLDGSIVKGRVYHFEKDGILKLIMLIIKDYEKTINNKTPKP